MRHGLAAALAHRHLLARMRVAVDRRINGAAMAAGQPPRERHVAAPHRSGAAVIGELRGERGMREVVLGDHHQPRGVLVQPVHDAGPAHATDARQRASAMGDQRVHQRAGLVARRGVHHQPPGLVEDDDVVVLEHDVEGDILAFRLRRDCFRARRL
ncbi:hypothetical protein ACVWW3_005343 [Bradyrhizobium sp. LM2.9]